MPDLEVLLSRIAMLATPDIHTDAQGRRVIAAGACPAAGLRDEVAETHLQRRLAFHNQRDEVLSLIVKAGRVIAVSHETTPALTQGHFDMPPGGVIAANLDLAPSVAQVIAMFLSNCTDLSVVSHFVVTALPAYDVGLDLGQIMQNGNGDDGAEPVATFASRLTQIAIASVVIDLAFEQNATGDADRCDLIAAIMGGQTLPDDGTNRCLILGCDAASAHAMVIAWQGGLQVGALIAQDKVTDVLSQWAAAMGASVG